MMKKWDACMMKKWDACMIKKGGACMMQKMRCMYDVPRNAVRVWCSNDDCQIAWPSVDEE